MNIMDYRAMKEQEQQQANSQTQAEEQTNVQAQPTTTEPDKQTNTEAQQSQSTPNETGAEGQTQTEPKTTEQPQVIEIDGVQVPIDELKNGYLRQSDYTRKTQEIAQAKRDLEHAEKFYQEFSKDPELAQQLAKQFNLPYVDPQQQQIVDLQNKYQDLLLEREVSTLQGKYQDFDTRGVLQFAYDRKIENLEDAYHLYKSYNATEQPQANQAQQVDVNSIKEQLRQEILRELQSNVDTTSIIQGGAENVPVKDNAPTLSNTELRIAQNMRMSPQEYAKWRDKR